MSVYSEKTLQDAQHHQQSRRLSSPSDTSPNANAPRTPKTKPLKPSSSPISSSHHDESVRVKAYDPNSMDLGVEGASSEGGVFGKKEEGGVDYQNMGQLATIVLMFKTQIGLGVLSLPSTFHTLGLVPGVILMVLIGLVMSFGQYVVGRFTRNHPEVYSVSDVGGLIAGRWGRYTCTIAYWLFMTVVAGSGMLSLSIALNAISLHGTCTAVFVAVAAVMAFLFASIQTLEKLAWLTWGGVVSLIASLFTVAIAVALVDRPAAAPQTGPWEKDFRITNAPSLLSGMSAVSQLVFAFAGTPAFHGIIVEMRDSRQFTRCLVICQCFMISLYLLIGILIYYYCGQWVASPALGSAGTTVKRVAYGLSIPALLASTCIYTHIPAKLLFIRILRGTPHLTRNTVRHWVVWLGSVLGCIVVSYVIASAVPVFNNLVGLIGALFGTFLCIILPAAMWLYDDVPKWNHKRSIPYLSLMGLSVFMLIVGGFIMVTGTWGSVKEIIDSYNRDGGTGAWSCADNSNSIQAR